MALSRTHWSWLREQVKEWRDKAGPEIRGNAADLGYAEGKRDGYREAAAELDDLLDAIKSWYE